MTFEQKGAILGAIADVKNKQYGDAFNKAGDFLKILYPNGVQPDQYQEMLVVTRIFDKLMRVANGDLGEESAFNDIGGYGILMSKVKEREYGHKE